METQQVLVRSTVYGNEKPRFDIDRGAALDRDTALYTLINNSRD